MNACSFASAIWLLDSSKIFFFDHLTSFKSYARKWLIFFFRKLRRIYFCILSSIYRQGHVCATTYSFTNLCGWGLKSPSKYFLIMHYLKNKNQVICVSSFFSIFSIFQECKDYDWFCTIIFGSLSTTIIFLIIFFLYLNEFAFEYIKKW